LLAIGFLAAYPLLHRQVDEQIRRSIEERIAQKYPDLKVTIRSAEYVAGEGFRLRGILFADPDAEGPRADLLSVEELFLSSKTDLKELLVSEPIVTRITARRPTLYATRRADGSWSISKLSPLPKFGESKPEIVVENATISILDPTKTPVGALPLRDVNLKIVSSVVAMPGELPREIRNIQGMFACDYLRRVEFNGNVDSASGACTFHGTSKGLEISSELRDALPEPLAAKMCDWGELRATGKFDFHIAYDPARPNPVEFRIDGSIDRGQINDTHLPHSLTEVNADFSAENSGFVIDVRSAKCSQAMIRKLSIQCQGYAPDSLKSIQADIRQLELDRALYAVLPPSLQEQWDNYQPFGKIDADAQMTFDGRKWKPNLTLRTSDISFMNVKKFPYRFEHGSGTLSLNENRLTLDMTAFGGGQPVRINSEVQNPLHSPTFNLEVRGNAFPLDAKLFDALPEKSQHAVRMLNPQGTIDFYFNAKRDVPGAPPHHHMVIELKRNSIRYEKFPYPINHITGRLVMFDERWDFLELKGVNNSSLITGDGSFRPSMEGNQLELNLKGDNLLLEQDLRNALPENLQRIWRELKPSGTIDARTKITYLAEKKKLSVEVAAVPQKDTASIEPSFFPYRMEKIQGELHYRDGHVTLDKLRAWHGSVELVADATCDFPVTKMHAMTLDAYGNPTTKNTNEFQAGGPWELHFTNLFINNLDRELIQALPERLRKGLLALNPSRPGNTNKSLANVHGRRLDFYHNGITGEPLQSAWDMDVNLFQNEIQCGMKLENMAGKISLKGRCDGRHVGSRGEIKLDSVNFKEYQFTNVSGPLWIDDERVLFGEWADDPSQVPSSPLDGPRQPRSISANLFEGVVRGKGWILLGADPKYGLDATLEQANLAKIIPGRQNLQGKINAGIGLKGSGSTRNSLSGAGSIRVSDAYVYELPAMMQMLKILRFSKPDPNAFSKISIGYRIEGEHIYFDPILFDGDAINLHGTGDMDWQANLNVNLAASITKNDSRIPLIGPMISDTSRGAMLIRVRGSLQNPDIDQVALPAMNQALQQFQDRKK
jgi:hypothetical protein